jgi:hypothetical protein
MLFTLTQQEKHPIEVVVLADAVYQSSLGKYFLGQTDLITFGGGYNAWGGLINPAGSKVNMFLNAYTISNFSHQSLTAEGWLSSTLPGDAKISPYVAAGNQAVTPAPKPKIEIQSANYVSKTPTGGTYTFVRRVESDQTLTKHDFQGMYIIPPASSFILYFLSPGIEMVKVRVAFGWWETDVAQ